MRIFSLVSFFSSDSSLSADVQVGEIETWSDFSRLYGSPGDRVPASPEHRQVEAILGYSFEHGELVKEAFSHPSKIDQVSFERSEWLGDAVRPFFSRFLPFLKGAMGAILIDFSSSSSCPSTGTRLSCASLGVEEVGWSAE